MFGTTDLRDVSSYLNFGVTDMNAATVESYGEAGVAAETQRVLDIHNAIVSELRSELCQTTTDYQSVYGGFGGSMKMIRGNEYSNPLVQKPSNPTVTMGFPLYKNEIAIQFTKRAFARMTLQKYSNILQNILITDVTAFKSDILEAVFKASNTPGWQDSLTDYKEIDIYAFLNGDGKPIPMAIDGSSFAGNHTHYTFATALDVSAVRDTLTNVIEHDANKDTVKIFINSASVSAFQGFQTSGAFYPYRQENVVLGADQSYATGQFLDMRSSNNKSIGLFDGFEVAVRTWVPVGYIVVVDTGSAGDKPLAYRIDPLDSPDLGIRYEDDNYPLRATVMDRVYGIAPWKRHKVAICYINANANAYVEPSFS